MTRQTRVIFILLWVVLGLLLILTFYVWAGVSVVHYRRSVGDRISGFGALDPLIDVEQPLHLHWSGVGDADYLRHRHYKPCIPRWQVIDYSPQIAKPDLHLVI
jgi:hypothetical protein